MAFLPMIPILAVFYFLLIRPQRKKRRLAMLEALEGRRSHHRRQHPRRISKSAIST
jgi:hypothetical protein